MIFKKFTNLLGILVVVAIFFISVMLFIETVTTEETPISEFIIDYDHKSRLLWPFVFKILISLIGIAGIAVFAIVKIKDKKVLS